VHHDEQLRDLIAITGKASDGSVAAAVTTADHSMLYRTWKSMPWRCDCAKEMPRPSQASANVDMFALRPSSAVCNVRIEDVSKQTYAIGVCELEVDNTSALIFVKDSSEEVKSTLYVAVFASHRSVATDTVFYFEFSRDPKELWDVLHQKLSHCLEALQPWKAQLCQEPLNVWGKIFIDPYQISHVIGQLREHWSEFKIGPGKRGVILSSRYEASMFEAIRELRPTCRRDQRPCPRKGSVQSISGQNHDQPSADNPTWIVCMKRTFIHVHDVCATSSGSVATTPGVGYQRVQQPLGTVAPPAKRHQPKGHHVD